jgi:GTPase SAR1 family protein
MEILTLKIVVLGSTAATDNSIFRRFILEEFKIKSKSPNGIDIHTKSIEYSPGKGSILSIWKVSTPFRLEEVRTNLYHDADGAIIVFNPFNNTSFREAQQLIDDVRDFLDEEIPFVLIGDWTYSSYNFETMLDRILILDFIYRENGFYIEVSPTSDSNVNLALTELTRRIVYSSS